MSNVTHSELKKYKDVNVPGGPAVRLLTGSGWEAPEVDTKMDGAANKIVRSLCVRRRTAAQSVYPLRLSP